MPKHYQRLQEKELPATFYELIRERETIYHERIVRKKMRKGELPADKIRSESMNVENELLDGNLAVAQTSTEPVLEIRAKS